MRVKRLAIRRRTPDTDNDGLPDGLETNAQEPLQ